MKKQNLPDVPRRDFLTQVTLGFGAVGAVCAAWPFVKSMAPAANVKAQATTVVDISDIAEGSGRTVIWQGKPVFIKHRTPAEIAEARDVILDQLPDPEADSARVQKPQWLVTLGVCTHLGCVPLNGGAYDGWLCPCHGSQFDTSGRVRRGPAPTNLPVPPYEFLDDNTIKIG